MPHPGQDQRRLATILSIDVVGYSRMMQGQASKLLAALNAIFRSVVRPEVEAAGGRIVKLLGDGAVIEFSSARGALTCAHAIQAHMRDPKQPYDYDEVIALRIGLHAGDVLADGDDIFGDGVNIAARLQAESEAGGVLLSKTVADLAGGDLPVRLRAEGRRSLKNISSPIETLSIDFSDRAVARSRADKAKSIEVRYCTSTDGQRLAWSSVGSGPPIVKAPSWISHLELDWRNPGMRHWFDSLSESHRFIYFDARGNGLSDWDLKSISFDQIVDDLGRVFDAAEIERAPILAISQGCPISIAFAAHAPERVSAIIMMGGFPQGRARRKSEKDLKRAAAMRAMMAAGWDDDHPSLRDLFAEIIVPLASNEDRRLYAEDMREMISPENLGRYREVLDDLDVTALLPKVQTPCLVMHCKGDRMHPIEQGRMMAAGIPDAKFIAYDSDNHNLSENDPCWPLAEREMHTFLRDHA